MHGCHHRAAAFCFAPIHADTRSGKLIFLEIHPSRRQKDLGGTEPQHVVVVMNPTPKGGDYNLVVGSASVQISSRPHSIQTVAF